MWVELYWLLAFFLIYFIPQSYICFRSSPYSKQTYDSGCDFLNRGLEIILNSYRWILYNLGMWSKKIITEKAARGSVHIHGASSWNKNWNGSQECRSRRKWWHRWCLGPTTYFLLPVEWADHMKILFWHFYMYDCVSISLRDEEERYATKV